MKGSIVVLLIVVLSAGGYFGWRWWDHRQQLENLLDLQVRITCYELTNRATPAYWIADRLSDDEVEAAKRAFFDEKAAAEREAGFASEAKLNALRTSLSESERNTFETAWVRRVRETCVPSFTPDGTRSPIPAANTNAFVSEINAASPQADQTKVFTTEQFSIQYPAAWFVETQFAVFPGDSERTSSAFFRANTNADPNAVLRCPPTEDVPTISEQVETRVVEGPGVPLSADWETWEETRIDNSTHTVVSLRIHPQDAPNEETCAMEFTDVDEANIRSFYESVVSHEAVAVHDLTPPPVGDIALRCDQLSNGGALVPCQRINERLESLPSGLVESSLPELNNALCALSQDENLLASSFEEQAFAEAFAPFVESGAGNAVGCESQTSTPLFLTQDSDGDGLNLMLEFLYGSSDNSRDSDQDSFDDLAEILNGYRPDGEARLEWTLLKQ